MQDKLELAFDICVREYIPNQDVAKYVIDHERKEVVMENLKAEIQTGVQRGLDKTDLLTVIQACAHLFATTVIKFAEETSLSEIERHRRISEANKMEDAQELLEEATSDTKTVSYPGQTTKEA